MAFIHSPKIVTSGLVLCLDAANKLSYPGTGTSWYDLSGNANTGTLTNGPTFSVANMGSIVFDGVDDYVNIPNNSSFNVTDNISVEMWVRIETTQSNNLGFLIKYAKIIVIEIDIMIKNFDKIVPFFILFFKYFLMMILNFLILV
jgi:hypothetical protein